ncbi:MAG: hypothetical protein CMH30_05450 [Micavibrio sp.]|nr:hypothetical protein [Micavibrio sp.]|tara:strand:+ start:3371 stop:4126 length:756 start_codon:yes stop_codon:yes gene_type:complete
MSKYLEDLEERIVNSLRASRAFNQGFSGKKSSQTDQDILELAQAAVKRQTAFFNFMPELLLSLNSHLDFVDMRQDEIEPNIFYLNNYPFEITAIGGPSCSDFAFNYVAEDTPFSHMGRNAPTLEEVLQDQLIWMIRRAYDLDRQDNFDGKKGLLLKSLIDQIPEGFRKDDPIQKANFERFDKELEHLKKLIAHLREDRHTPDTKGSNKRSTGLSNIHQMAVSFVAKRPLVIVLSILAAPTVYMLAQQYIPK